MNEDSVHYLEIPVRHLTGASGDRMSALGSKASSRLTITAMRLTNARDFLGALSTASLYHSESDFR